jgi:hypothetical protein
MAFADLTTEQKNVLSDYVRLTRAWCGEQARTNNHADALNCQYAQVQAILGELGNDDVVTDGSGLSGAMELTKAEIVTLTAHMQGILTNYNTLGHRQMWAKAAGPGNLIG